MVKILFTQTKNGQDTLHTDEKWSRSSSHKQNMVKILKNSSHKWKKNGQGTLHTMKNIQDTLHTNEKLSRYSSHSWKKKMVKILFTLVNKNCQEIIFTQTKNCQEILFTQTKNGQDTLHTNEKWWRYSFTQTKNGQDTLHTNEKWSRYSSHKRKMVKILFIQMKNGQDPHHSREQKMVKILFTLVNKKMVKIYCSYKRTMVKRYSSHERKLVKILFTKNDKATLHTNEKWPRYSSHKRKIVKILFIQTKNGQDTLHTNEKWSRHSTDSHKWSKYYIDRWVLVKVNASRREINIVTVLCNRIKIVKVFATLKLSYLPSTSTFLWIKYASCILTFCYLFSNTGPHSGWKRQCITFV